LSADDLPTADRVVTLPLLSGRPVAGLPADAGGFLPVDPSGRVLGLQRVWGAGDGTDFPIKQGGLAAQQAEVAARSIASLAGRQVETTPFEPILRGMLIAGRQTWYLRRRLDGIDLGQVSPRALWWPPTKIAGLHLATFLQRLDAEERMPQIEVLL
jgi:sulfide:quinone oxidoreductase